MLFKPLTAEEAKEKVFEHWTDLDKLAKRKFPNQENLALQAVIYALDKLENNEWQRVRSWEGKGLFLTFLITLTSRLLIDYKRQQFGHIRLPRWILDKLDELWNQAYRFLQVRKYDRQETIEQLRSTAPDRPIEDLEQMVGEILSRCPARPPPPETTVPLNWEKAAPVEHDPSKNQEFTRNEVIEILSHFVDGKESQALPQHLQNEVKRLRSQLSLNEEDRMFLYLHYIEDLSFKVIDKRMHLKGSPYKRHNRLVNRLQQACKQTELTFDLDDDTNDQGGG